MKKSSEPAPTNRAGDEWPDLEFPVNPDFDPRPPRLDPQVMLKRIAETLPWRSTRPGETERRLAEKIEEEFFL